MHSWRVLILPYMGPEEQLVYKQYDMSTPWDGPTNSWLASRMPSVYGCPADPECEFGTTSYLAVTGKGLVFDGKETKMRADLQRGDGESQTIMIVEATESGVSWLQPTDLDLHQLALGVNSDVDGTCCSNHPQAGVNVATADGKVHFISEDTLPEELKAMATINGGEIVEVGN